MVTRIIVPSPPSDLGRFASRYVAKTRRERHGIKLPEQISVDVIHQIASFDQGRHAHESVFTVVLNQVGAGFRLNVGYLPQRYGGPTNLYFTLVV